MKKSLAIILLLPCLACGQGMTETQRKEIDNLIAGMVKPESAGVTVAVAEGDRILFSKGYGSANPEYDIPNSPKTVFHVASVSKQFTAFAIALLADQGKISLDDDIRRYLPELQDFKHTITIKHLAHHTSGLRDQWNLLALAGWRLDDVITRNQVLRLISHQTELNARPGDEFNYCNTGYTLMAEIVSRVTGKNFAQWCRENIFTPLGMENTLFYDDHEKIVKNRAYSFQDTPEGLKKSVLSYANAGATSLFTTAEDLTKWSANFYSMKVGNRRVMKQMEERGILNKGDTTSYAFGQGIGKYKGLRLISHSGADAGYRSVLMRFPEQKLSIVVLSNLGSFNPGGLASRIADVCLKDQLKETVEKKPEAGKQANAVVVREELLKLYEGQYQLTNEMVLTLKPVNGTLNVQATGQPAMALQAKSESEFVLDQYGVKIVFDNIENSPAKELTFSQGGQTMVATRVKPFDSRSVVLKDFVGTYYSPELETSYTIVLKDDTLSANHIRHEPVLLTPVAKDAFATNSWFMSKLEFVRNAQGEITGLKISSGRVKHVRFVKRAKLE